MQKVSLVVWLTDYTRKFGFPMFLVCCFVVLWNFNYSHLLMFIMMKLGYFYVVSLHNAVSVFNLFYLDFNDDIIAFMTLVASIKVY